MPYQSIRYYIIERYNQQNDLKEIISPIPVAQHVVTNLITKNMIRKPGLARDAAKALFRQGVKDAKKGKRVKSFAKGAINSLLGPETIEIYDRGRKSSRTQRLVGKILSKTGEKGSIQQAMGDIASGAPSEKFKKLVSKVPKNISDTAGKILKTSSPEGKYSKAAEVAGHVAGAIPSPIIGAINTGRSALLQSKVGKNISKGWENAGKKIAAKGQGQVGKAIERVKHGVADAFFSPSYSIMKDKGKEKYKALQPGSMPLKKLKSYIQTKEGSKNIKDLYKSVATDPKSKRYVMRKALSAGFSKDAIRKAAKGPEIASTIIKGFSGKPEEIIKSSSKVAPDIANTVIKYAQNNPSVRRKIYRKALEKGMKKDTIRSIAQKGPEYLRGL